MGRGQRTGRGHRYLRDGQLREAGLRARHASQCALCACTVRVHNRGSRIKNSADVSTAFTKLPCLTHMKPNRETIEAEDLVKERLPLTKWELTPKEKEDFDRVMRLVFDAAGILLYDLELGEDAIGKTLKELADWATN